ncbi:MAG TPA: methyltransferase [Sphingomonas sp.]|uniref:methyltransferase n=1 Tax=Sphingomonas sp. TaxID=28214 RepID=UPI002EDB72E2
MTQPPLGALLRILAAQEYRFVTVSPATHARVVARDGRHVAHDLRDILGWSLPFRADAVPAEILALLEAGGAVRSVAGGLLQATVRVSCVHGLLFLHSAYPTTEADAVFLGPDSYRFADLIMADSGTLPAGARILDYGAGAGVGGIVAARHQPDARLTLADINPRALFLASINAAHAGVRHETVAASSPDAVTGAYDLIVANPPFMMDHDRRAYRDGGDLHGARLSLDWVLAGVGKLTPGGRLILYTGVAIVDGRDALLDALRRRLPDEGLRCRYRELDPDIFGEELDQPAYAEVERIAAVGLCVERRTDQAVAGTTWGSRSG